MEYVVLGLLILKSQTVYELNKSFERGISLFYSASYGSLQTAIKNLLKKDLITFQERTENGRNKKVYIVADSGKEAFFKWMKADIPTNKLEVSALSKLYFLGLVESTQQKKEILKGIIEKIQMIEEDLKKKEDEIARYEVPDSYQNIFHYQLKTLNYGIHAHHFAKDWFKALLRELN